MAGPTDKGVKAVVERRFLFPPWTLLDVTCLLFPLDIMAYRQWPSLNLPWCVQVGGGKDVHNISKMGPWQTIVDGQVEKAVNWESSALDVSPSSSYDPGQVIGFL